jgi:serine protease Do
MIKAPDIGQLLASAKCLATTLVAIAILGGAHVTAQQRDVNAEYSRLATSANQLQPQHNQIRDLVRVTRGCVAHIDAKKPRNANTKIESSSAKVAMVEEAGSGVLIEYRERFFVITNYHVVEGADVKNIQVRIQDKLYRPVDTRNDRESDLSVMLLEGDQLQPAVIGDSQKVDVGDFVVAIGSPFGLSHSVSYGIISAMNRHDLELGPQGVRYQDFFQTDASINPGNSGGPLFNLAGEVIGINTAIASNSGGSDGIGFAIPMHMVMRITQDLIDLGYVRRGYVGVSLSGEFTAADAMDMGLREAYGAQVTAIAKGSPAEKAGIKIGDVVLKIGDRKVADDSHLVTLVSLLPVGEDIPFEVFRKGEYKTFNVNITQK